MREYIEALAGFYNIYNDRLFIEEKKKVTSTINSILAKIYLSDGDEIKLVNGTIDAFNKTPGHRFKMESMFIHGNKSQVEFNYYGNQPNRELGDLIIVSTMTYNSRPIVQKMTIVQAKRDTKKKSSFWGIDNEQLFLLSTWPPFKGVKGFFPKGKNMIVADSSGCLGSYLLFREPGDFVFVAAPTLGRILGSKKSVKFSELVGLQGSCLSYNHQQSFLNQIFTPLQTVHPKEWLFFLEEIFHYSNRLGEPFPFLNKWSNDLFLGNQYVALNVCDTVNHLSLLNIGELIYSEIEHIKVNEQAFKLLNTVVKYLKGRIREGNDLELFNYMGENAPIFDGVDLDGVTIGLIHSISEVAIG